MRIIAPKAPKIQNPSLKNENNPRMRLKNNRQHHIILPEQPTDPKKQNDRRRSSPQHILLHSEYKAYPRHLLTNFYDLVFFHLASEDLHDWILFYCVFLCGRGEFWGGEVGGV